MNVRNPFMYQMFVCRKILFAGIFNFKCVYFFVPFSLQLSLPHVAVARVKTTCSGTLNWFVRFSIQHHSNKRLVVDLIPCSFSWGRKGTGMCCIILPYFPRSLSPNPLLSSLPPITLRGMQIRILGFMMEVV